VPIKRNVDRFGDSLAMCQGRVHQNGALRDLYIEHTTIEGWQVLLCLPKEQQCGIGSR
jgi:hypothetical protein